MSIRSAMLAIALLAATAGSVAAARAAPPAHAPAKSAAAPAPISLEGAVEQVQKQTRGRILSADTIPNGRAKLYRIKVLTPDGHVRVLQLDSDQATAHPKTKKGGPGG